MDYVATHFNSSSSSSSAIVRICLYGTCTMFRMLKIWYWFEVETFLSIKNIHNVCSEIFNITSFWMQSKNRNAMWYVSVHLYQIWNALFCDVECITPLFLGCTFCCISSAIHILMIKIVNEISDILSLYIQSCNAAAEHNNGRFILR